MTPPALLAEARQATGNQDRSLQYVPLAEVEASMASERCAWQLAEKQAKRSISYLDHEWGVVSRSLEEA